MDVERIRRRFLGGAAIYPPMGIFEPPAEPAALALLSKCESHAGHKKGDFYAFLGRLMDAASGGLSFAFFGNSINGSRFPMDIDLLLFIPSSYALSAPHCRLGFIHECTIFENPLIPSSKPAGYRFLLSHSLLMFPDTPSSFPRKLIEDARDHISGAPFLEGGVGDLIVYSAFKALNNNEYHFLEGCQALRGARFRIDWNSFDAASMRSGPITPMDLLAQVKEQMKAMDEAELDALTRAALRRLRVRGSSKGPLEKRFVSEVRRYRAPCR